MEKIKGVVHTLILAYQFPNVLGVILTLNVLVLLELWHFAVIMFARHNHVIVFLHAIPIQTKMSVVKKTLLHPLMFVQLNLHVLLLVLG